MKTRKVIIGILSILGILLILSYYYINWSFNQPCPPPKKPTSVPKKAVWKGGCDGGHWVEWIGVKKRGYRFKIYRDWDGHLTLDTDFKLEECSGIEITQENWKDYVTGFSGETLEIKNLSQSKDWKCRLVPVYPAYGGDQWEIIKEKKERE